MPEPKDIDSSKISDAEQQGVLRAREFGKFGIAYAVEHATKPSTIGLVLSSSPVAFLAW